MSPLTENRTEENSGYCLMHEDSEKQGENLKIPDGEEKSTNRISTKQLQSPVWKIARGWDRVWCIKEKTSCTLLFRRVERDQFIGMFIVTMRNQLIDNRNLNTG